MTNGESGLNHSREGEPALRVRDSLGAGPKLGRQGLHLSKKQVIGLAREEAGDGADSSGGKQCEEPTGSCPMT